MDGNKMNDNEISELNQSIKDYCGAGTDMELASDTRQFIEREIAIFDFAQLHSLTALASSNASSLPRIKLIEGPSDDWVEHSGKQISGIVIRQDNCQLYVHTFHKYEN